MKKRVIIIPAALLLVVLCLGICAGIPEGDDVPVDDALGRARTSGAPPRAPQTPGEVEERSLGPVQIPDRTGSPDEMMVRTMATFRGQRAIQCAVPFPPSEQEHTWNGFGYRVRPGPPRSRRDPSIGAQHGELAASVSAQRSGGDTWIRAEFDDTDLLFQAPGLGLIRITAPRSEEDVVRCTSVTIVAPEIPVHGVVLNADGTPRSDARVRLTVGADSLRVDEHGRFAGFAPAGPGAAYVGGPEGGYTLPFEATGEDIELVTDEALSLPPDLEGALSLLLELDANKPFRETVTDALRDLVGRPDATAEDAAVLEAVEAIPEVPVIPELEALREEAP